uniref:Uncharacterized protein n=1 Tax=Amphimedon queenslandica TaxID=400682 RepID=A0A1X7TTN0_AMPQE
MADNSNQVSTGHKAVGEAESIKLLQLRRSLRDKSEVINSLDNEIVGLTDDADELTADLLEDDEFSQKIHEALIKIEKHLMTPFTPANTETTGPVAAVPSPSTRTRLSLKTFRGELTEWFTFCDGYKALIHDNVRISDIDKFTYLRSLLKRSALESINGIALTAANYLDAIEILTKPFGNKQQIIAQHMVVWLSIEYSGNGIAALCTLYDLLSHTYNS